MLDDRVVLITGSSRGIGLALARACVNRSARVVVHGRDAARVEAVARELGPRAIPIVEELAVDGGAERLVERALAACGRIDVLVNNAAVGDEGAATLAINLAAPIAACRAVVARKQAVRIVNVSSGLVAMPRPNAAMYIASKAGLDAFTRAFALDVPSDVTVTAMALGSYRTELARAMLSADEYTRAPEADRAAALLLWLIEQPRELVHGRIGEAVDERELDVAAIDLIAHPLGPSPRVREALAAAAQDEPFDRYPAPPDELREVLAAKHRVGLDRIVVGAGISELLDRVVGALARPGEAAIANVPSWPLWPYVCRARRVAWKPVPYRVDGNAADHALDEIAAALDPSVRLVYVTNPGNPSGAAIDARAFARFVERVPPTIAIVVDEAYIDFATRDGVLDAAAMARWSDAPIVVLRSLSKLHGLAGLRVAYAIAPAAICKRLARVAPPFPLVRGVERAAIAALSDAAHARATIARVVDNRAALEAALDARGIRRLASDAPFVLAAVSSDVAPGPRWFGEYVMLPLPWEIERIVTSSR